MASMSRSRFSTTFHEVVGTTLKAYVHEVKLKRAQRLMLSSALSPSEIASKAGFYDRSHLGRAIRRRHGMTPQAFRHRHRRSKKRDTR